MAYGMRTGEIKGIVHGAQWDRHTEHDWDWDWRRGKGRAAKCPMGCGRPCDIRHVVMAECIACEDKKGAYRRGMMTGIHRIDEEMVKTWGKTKQEAGVACRAREAARGNTWKKAIYSAKKGIVKAIQDKHQEITDEEWGAIRRIIGGVLPKPAGQSTWGEREQRAKEDTVAEAVGMMQDMVAVTIEQWREKSAKHRGQWAQREERMKWEASITRGWRMKKKTKGRLTVDRRTCKWEMEGIQNVLTARWEDMTHGTPGWEYLVRTGTNDIGWVQGTDIVRKNGGHQNNTEWTKGAMVHMGELRTRYTANMERKGKCGDWGEEENLTTVAQDMQNGETTEKGTEETNKEKKKDRRLPIGCRVTDILTHGIIHGTVMGANRNGTYNIDYEQPQEGGIISESEVTRQLAHRQARVAHDSKQDDGSTRRLMKGYQVMNYLSDGRTTRGVITRSNMDGTYDIKYELPDGCTTREEKVPDYITHEQALIAVDEGLYVDIGKAQREKSEANRRKRTETKKKQETEEGKKKRGEQDTKNQHNEEREARRAQRVNMTCGKATQEETEEEKERKNARDETKHDSNDYIRKMLDGKKERAEKDMKMQARVRKEVVDIMENGISINPLYRTMIGGIEGQEGREGEDNGRHMIEETGEETQGTEAGKNSRVKQELIPIIRECEGSTYEEGTQINRPPTHGRKRGDKEEEGSDTPEGHSTSKDDKDIRAMTETMTCYACNSNPPDEPSWAEIDCACEGEAKKRCECEITCKCHVWCEECLDTHITQKRGAQCPGCRGQLICARPIHTKQTWKQMWATWNSAKKEGYLRGYTKETGIDTSTIGRQGGEEHANKTATHNTHEKERTHADTSGDGVTRHYQHIYVVDTLDASTGNTSKTTTLKTGRQTIGRDGLGIHRGITGAMTVSNTQLNIEVRTRTAPNSQGGGSVYVDRNAKTNPSYIRDNKDTPYRRIMITHQCRWRPNQIIWLGKDGNRCTRFPVRLRLIALPLTHMDTPSITQQHAAKTSPPPVNNPTPDNHHIKIALPSQQHPSTTMTLPHQQCTQPSHYHHNTNTPTSPQHTPTDTPSEQVGSAPAARRAASSHENARRCQATAASL